MSQSILVQKQRLGHLLVKSGPAAEKKIERKNKCRKPVQIIVQQLQYMRDKAKTFST